MAGWKAGSNMSQSLMDLECCTHCTTVTAAMVLAICSMVSDTSDVQLTFC